MLAIAIVIGFCMQGNPFLHNKHFLQLLEDPTEMQAVQTMSAVYSYDVEDKYHTPSEAGA